MNITGVFLADPAGYRDPINIQLVNTQASY